MLPSTSDAPMHRPLDAALVLLPTRMRLIRRCSFVVVRPALRLCSSPCACLQRSMHTHLPVFAEKAQLFAPSLLVFIRRADLAARCVALIRLWPNIPSDSPDAAECAALAVSSLEQGVLWAQPQHLIQAPQALGVAALRKAMCALSRQRSPGRPCRTSPLLLISPSATSVANIRVEARRHT